MRNIKIIFTDLKKFLIQKKYVFIVLLVSLIVTSYSFCFFIASSMHIANLMNDYRNPSTKYYVGNTNGIHNLKISDLEKWLDTNNLKDSTINIYSDIQKQNSKSDDKEEIINNHVIHDEFVIQQPHEKFDIVIGTNCNKSNRVSFVGDLISNRDIKEKTNYVMIEYLSKEARDNPFIINNLIRIRDEEYIVKAIDRIDYNLEILNYSNIHNYDRKMLQPMLISAVIPISTFMDKYNTYGFDIILSKNATKQQKEELSEYLNLNFYESEIKTPKRIENVKIDDVTENIVMFSLLIILSLINIIALFTYWIDKNWRKYMIYRICGASSRKIYFIIVIEALLLCIVSIILGVILYYLTIPLLQKIYINYVLKISEIIMIQSIIIVLVFLYSSFEAFRMSKINPRYIERR